MVAGTVVNQLDDDCAIRRGRRLLLILRRRLGHQSVQPLRRQGRDHHENNQQHQQHVNQGRDVHVRVLAPFGAHCHSHNRSPVLLLLTYCPPVGACGAGPGGGLKDPDFFCSVKRPSWSTPAARTLSTTSTTHPNFARPSAFTTTLFSVPFANFSF